MDIGELLGIKKLYGQITIGVKDMERAVGWYSENLGLSVWARRSDCNEVHLGYPTADKRAMIPLVVLVPIPDGRTEAAVGRHPILFTKKIEKRHGEFASRGVYVEPIQSDSGGNRFFRFQDLDGNLIEVCVEP